MAIKHWRDMDGRIFYFVGLKRSGQHAIIEWIANHFEGRVGLTNNCISWPPKTWKTTHFYHEDKANIRILRGRERFLGPVVPCEARIITIEDPFKKYVEEDMDIGGEGSRHVACIRSFWNNAASRMKINDNHSASYDERFPIWWQQMARFDQEKWQVINYDLWNKDYFYRATLSDALKLNRGMRDWANQASITTAHKGYAGNVGSSFDKWAMRTDVGARWERMMDDGRFRGLVADRSPDVEACRYLNKQLFGWTLNYDGEVI